MAKFHLHSLGFKADPGDAGPHAPLRARRRRFKAVPIRLVLPNLVTLLALSMGLTSIRFAVEGKFDYAVYAVLIAAILDGLDGRLARAIRGTSRFGAELDSLADFIDFGVAPAFILYFSSLQQIKSFGWFAAVVFAIAAALRLARFNVMLDNPDKPAWHAHFFTGMPAPAGAIVGLLPLYLQLSTEIPAGFKLPVGVEIGYVILVAFLMASRVPHFSGKKIGRIPREYVIVVLFAVAALLVLIATFPLEVMVAISLVYLASVPFAIRRFQRCEHADDARALAAEDLGVPAPQGPRPVPPLV
ncbi:MAG: phosphatidylcholine/phosphatidylserine synthase [Beijerinckiaceae bacterium]|nr:phosphatidylcholine/phosphatidylserine synthase [Beijerinckiaceae bacterium]